MGIVITSSFLDRRTEALERQALERATSAGKERFRESENAITADLSQSITGVSDAMHPKVEALLGAPVRDFVRVDEEALRLSLRHYLYRKVESAGQGGTRIDVPWKACLDYFEGLLVDLAVMSERGKTIVMDPYVSTWKEKGRYDFAWDAAIYGYLFFHRRKGNRLTRSDYADMGIRAYYDWYGQGVSRHEFNVGKFMGDRLPRLLPLVADCPFDAFRKPLATTGA